MAQIPPPPPPPPAAPPPPPAAPPPPPGVPPPSGPPVAHAAAANSTYTCPWCRSTSVNPGASCPACGAPVNIRERISDSGWVEMPPIKDMARIQFDKSRVQISGSIVPIADFELDPADSVYFSHHMLLWKDDATPISAMKMRGGIKRVFAGLPIVMTQASGPGHIAFSRDVPGEMVAVPLPAGTAINVREHHFVVATHTTAYDWIQSNVWYQTRNGDDTEMHYPLGRYMDVFHAPQQHGLVMLHAAGNAFTRQLVAGQSILIQAGSLLFADATVAMGLHIEQPYSANGWRPWRTWSNRHVWLRLFGPGRVCVQSAYEHDEDAQGSLVSSQGYTFRAW